MQAFPPAGLFPSRADRRDVMDANRVYRRAASSTYRRSVSAKFLSSRPCRVRHLAHDRAFLVGALAAQRRLQNARACTSSAPPHRSRRRGLHRRRAAAPRAAAAIAPPPSSPVSARARLRAAPLGRMAFTNHVSPSYLRGSSAARPWPVRAARHHRALAIGMSTPGRCVRAVAAPPYSPIEWLCGALMYGARQPMVATRVAGGGRPERNAPAGQTAELRSVRESGRLLSVTSANAGTTPVFQFWRRPEFKSSLHNSSWGYGSRPSPGRPEIIGAAFTLNTTPPAPSLL